MSFTFPPLHARPTRSFHARPSHLFFGSALCFLPPLQDEEFVGTNSFQVIEDVLIEGSAAHFDAFKSSKAFKEMLKALGPKYLEVCARLCAAGEQD